MSATLTYKGYCLEEFAFSTLSLWWVEITSKLCCWVCKCDKILPSLPKYLLVHHECSSTPSLSRRRKQHHQGLLRKIFQDAVLNTFTRNLCKLNVHHLGVISFVESYHELYKTPR